MTSRQCALIPLLAAILAAPVMAGEREDACRARAERLSGYSPGGLEGQAGELKFRLRGSLAIGGGRSSGPPTPAPPPFAGEAHRERFEAERDAGRADRYRRILDDCLRELEVE